MCVAVHTRAVLIMVWTCRSDEVIGVNDPSGVSDQSGRDLLPPEPLGEQAQNESSLAIQEFGMELVLSL